MPDKITVEYLEGRGWGCELAYSRAHCKKLVLTSHFKDGAIETSYTVSQKDSEENISLKNKFITSNITEAIIYYNELSL